MRLLLIIALLALPMTISAPASAGNCDFASDRASDGSRCGGRAASEREGGRSGW
jgi:hypothetical protein